MRAFLIALLAFAAGVLLMILITHPPLHDASHDTAGIAHADSSEPAADASIADEAGDADPWPDAPSPEQVIYDQPRLLQQALDRLAPRIPGKPNLYLLSFAGDGGGRVFHNEAEYAARLFEQRFNARGHTLVLENSPDTLQTQPLATWTNLDSAMAGFAKRMDPAQDILLLYITSHGSEDHSLLINMDPLPLDQIEAPDLAEIVKKYPFRWKVIVVNACYSGGFIPPLESPGTLIFTSAASNRSSFGCGNDDDATFFGRAWLVDGLNHNPNLIQAFRYAYYEIGRWERRDNFIPSRPQIAIGFGIEPQLQRWNQSFIPGPPLPYHPAPPPRVPPSSTPAAAGSAPAGKSREFTKP